ncbi:hypothetical protein B0H14DRAFT_3487110 [Mycena olivaceomarginata]|nr:hypothetical protein B0H14DRAFT_3487110 [Mycena olivaceomarginata]
MHRLHAGKLPSSQAQYTALLYSSRAFAEPATPQPAAAQLRVRAQYPWDYRPCAYKHVEHVWPPLTPAFRLSLLLLPSFPSITSTFSAPYPFLVSLLPPHPTAHCQPTAEPRQFTNASWCCPFLCTACLDSRVALLCGSRSASKMPSMRCQLCTCLAIHQVPTAPPILPSSSTHFPSHLKPPYTARLWMSPPTRDLAI